MSATILHFVRHCDVENPEGVVYGRLPGFSLSALGFVQAQQVAAFLALRPITEIYSSPQLRAKQTARIIHRARTDARMHLSRRLSEVFSSYQGMKVKDIPSTVNMFDSPKDPGDESMEDVFRRMTRFVARIRRLHAGGEIACVSHAAPIAILRVGLEERPFIVDALRGPGEPQKGSVTTIILDGDEKPVVQYVPTHDVEAKVNGT